MSKRFAGSDVRRVLGGILSIVLMVAGVFMLYPRNKQPQSQGNSAATDDMQSIQQTASEPSQEGKVMNKEDYLVPADSFYRVWDDVLEGADGQMHALASMNGAPFALTVFASYCGDCKVQMEHASAFAKQAKAQNGTYQLVARIDAQGKETRENAEKYLAEKKMDIPYLLDSTGSFSTAIGIRSIPTTLFFSAQGKLMAAHSQGTLSPSGFSSYMRYASEGGALQTERFVLSELVTSEGGLVGQYEIDPPGNVRQGKEVLAESMGMLMCLAISSDDRALFDRTLAYVDAWLTKEGLAAWRSVNGIPADVNATLDDMRIAYALLQADAKWPDGGYAAKADIRLDALHASVVQGDKLLGHVNLSNGDVSNEIPLCYLDPVMLRTLANHDARFRIVAIRSAETLSGGRISDAFPLYYPAYDYAAGRYRGDTLQMNEAALTLLHMAQAGKLPADTLAYLVAMLERGPVYARYDIEGRVVSDYRYESTATYALLARVGLATGNDRLVRLAMWRMERIRVFDAQSKLDGSYAVDAGMLHYTFDLLCAMETWHALMREEGFLHP